MKIDSTKNKNGLKCLILIKKDIFIIAIYLIFNTVTILKRKGWVSLRMRVPDIYSGHFPKSRF